MLTFTAQGRIACCASDEPLTSGSVGVNCVFILDTATFADLVVWAVFRAGNTQRDVQLTTINDAFEGPLGAPACAVPWEVLEYPGPLLRVGVYATRGDGTLVVPTVWADAGTVLPGTRRSELDPLDPSPDIAAQLIESAQQTVAAAETVLQETQQTAADAHGAADAADASAQIAEAWAVGERRGAPVPPSDPAYNNNARHYADVAAQHAQHAGYIFVDVDDQTGQLMVTTTDHLAEELRLSVDETTGNLEVII